MALAPRSRLHTRGDWPGPVVIRRGWARAEARPWNADYPDASLRLVRGAGAFLDGCVGVLRGFGVPAVLSPPLPGSAQRPWLDVGFEVHVELALMRAELDQPIPTPDHLVVPGDVDELDDILRIDNAAFRPFWRFDRNGLLESIRATNRSTLYVIRDSDGRPAAFAITGIGHAIAYLQRVAVHPDWQGRGMGRSLVRVAARKARAAGASAILLNTQYDNDPASRLYESEGYTTVPGPLALLRFTY